MDDTIHKSSFRNSKTLLGYVLDEITLSRIHNYACSALRREENSNVEVEIACTSGGKVVTFATKDAFTEHFSKTRELIERLRMDYQSDKGRIEVYFEEGGKIEINALGPTGEFHFVSEGLAREIENCKRNHNGIIRAVVFSKAPRKFISMAILLLAGYLLTNIVYFIYATQIGVDISPDLLHEGNQYYREIEVAITSDSTEEKLNVLLKGHLKGFVNVSDVLQRTQRTIMFLIAGLMTSLIILLGMRSFGKNYPESFFSIGLGREEMAKIERRREIWIVGVVIAFGVNILAGAIVAFVP